MFEAFRSFNRQLSVDGTARRRLLNSNEEIMNFMDPVSLYPSPTNKLLLFRIVDLICCHCREIVYEDVRRVLGLK